MPKITNLPEAQRDDFIARLKRIEGQARGIQKMVEEGRECADILDQVASIKAATNSLSGEVIEAFALRCMSHPEEFDSPTEAIQSAVRAIVRAGR